MSSKHVNFDDDNNSTKEFERASTEEKGDLWYSKEEKESNRKEVQAEVMMEHSKAIVTKTVLEMEEYKGQTEDSEEIQAVIQNVLSQGVDGVIDFLAKHGNGAQLPMFNRASARTKSADPVSPATKFSVEENEATDAEARKQVRDLVKHQIVVLMKSGRVDASSISAEDLEKKTDDIMKLPRMEILKFLEEKPVLPASTNAAKPPLPYNWVNDGKHGWEDLPPPIQGAATVLGYDAESWNEKKQPEKSDKVWEDLSNEQQEAAIRLGFNPFSWDGIDPSEQEESERYLDDDSSSSSSSSSSSDDSDHGEKESTEEEETAASPEEAMKNTVRDLVKAKLLEAEAFNEDNVDATVDTVMELPKPQIMAFLQHPLPEHWTTTPQASQEDQDDTEVGGDDSEVGGRDSMVFDTFVLAKDEDDDKPMDDESSSEEEEEEPKKPLPTTYKSDEEEEDEFLANFLSDDEGDLDDNKENINAVAKNKDIESGLNNETTPLLAGRSLPSGGDDDDPKKPTSTVKVILVGLGIAVLGWFVYKKMR
ncbi:MAG: hypothetical protein SGBAC_011709 [Bacillariaceae sp.]